MFKCILPYVMLLFTFISCNTEMKYEGVKTFEWNDFQNTQELKSRIFLNDTIVFRPKDVQVCENYLITIDYGGERGLCQIYDLRTKAKIGERISKGNGPLEMLTPRFVKCQSGKIAIWDAQSSIIHKYDVKQFIESESPIPSEVIQLKKNAFVNVGFVNEGIIGQLYDKQYQLCQYDTLGKPLATFAEFPRLKSNDYNDIVKRDAYYMNFTSDEKSTIAICYCMTDLIDLYDLDFNLKKRLHGPDYFFAHFKRIESNQIESSSPIADKCRDAFFVPKSYNDYFTVMYNGRFLSEEGHNSSSDKILSFTWEGKPLDCYHLDKKIVSYDFDEKNKKIYAIAIDPEYVILEYEY